MEESSRDLAVYNESRELDIPFPLVQDLFKEGERTFGGAANGSAGDYYDEESTVRKPKLPDKFKPLVLGDDPDKYFFVYYDDRRGDYYKSEKGQTACLATRENKKAANDRMREIIYGNNDLGFFVTISEHINSRVFQEWRDAGEPGIVEPWGDIRAKYRLVDKGKRELVELTASRVDEVMFGGPGESYPCRWTRNLRVNRSENETEYKELYIVNRSKDLRQEKRADVAFQVTGDLSNPNRVTVAIGFGPESYARTIAESADKKVRIVVYKDFEGGLDILRTDPNFSFLNDDKLDGDKVLALVRERIALLQEHWDKPQSVFDTNPRLKPVPKQIV